MQENQQICENCNKKLPSSKIATHFSYCKKNIKKCQFCSEMYDINLKEQHQQQFHTKSPCQYCQHQFLSKQLQKHIQNCFKKPKYCQFCQQNIPINQFQIHVQQCASRTQSCQNCGKDIPNKFYYSHLLNCQKQSFQQKSKASSKLQMSHIQKQKEKIPLSRKEQFEKGQYPHLSSDVIKQNYQQKKLKKEKKIAYGMEQYQIMKKSEKLKDKFDLYQTKKYHGPEQKNKPSVFIDLEKDEKAGQHHSSNIQHMQQLYQYSNNLQNNYDVQDQEQQIQQAILASLQTTNDNKSKEQSNLISPTYSSLKPPVKKDKK